MYEEAIPRPDVVLRKYRTVVFVHGCFWHGHKNCKASKLPDTRRDFGEQKITGNIARDESYIQMLNEMGWKVLIIWECALKYRNSMDREAAIATLANSIRTGSQILAEIPKGDYLIDSIR